MTEAQPYTSLTIAQALKVSTGHTGHARGCKKAPDACKTCCAAIAWYAGLPLPLLSQVLYDRAKPHRA